MKKIALFPLVLVASCAPFSKRINSQVDLDRGQHIVDKFYGYVKAGNFSDASALCGADAAPKDAEALLQKMNGDWGSVQETSFVDGKSDVTEKDHHINGEIDLNYSATYDHSSNNEDFVLKFVGDSLKIAGYHSKVKDK